MKILDITIKDLWQTVRDWKTAFFLLIMPLGFTLMFGSIWGGTQADEVDTRLPVAFVDRDGGELSPYLVSLLEESRVIRLETQDDDSSLDRNVASDKLAAAIIVPEGYSQSLLAGEAILLEIIVNTTSNAGMSAQSEVQAVVNRLQGAVRTALISTQVFDESHGFSDEAARQAYFYAGLEAALAAWDRPPITLEISLATSHQEDSAYGNNAYAHSSPGMMAQFAIAGLIGSAEVVVVERKSRVLQRLLTTAVRKWEILAGHFLAIFTLIFTQYMLLMGFGDLFLGLNYFETPLAALFLTLTTALFAGSLGLLIGILAKNEEQVIVLSLLPMFVLSGLGGAWVPLEATSETVQLIGHFTPVAWMMDGYKGILIRGWGFSEIIQPGLALLGFAVLCLRVTVWKFRRE